MITGNISIGKFEQNCLNEDASLAKKQLIAISDGAGGGGLFAERWSAYLLEHLPESPLYDADDLDTWIGKIWEPYYNQCETDAKLLGGMSLDKFYDEGSFATLVAVWQQTKTLCCWVAFGDSVAFHYNYATKELQHSFGNLGDFDNPPYLINCKDELRKEGFRKGVFHMDKHSVVFAASDALAHYILMMYEMANKRKYMQELNEAVSHHSKNENYINAANALSVIDFERSVLGRLLSCMHDVKKFRRHLQSLCRKGLLAHDDYSLAVMGK